MKTKPSTRLAALVLAFALLLPSCGSGTSAATIHLRKTEGTVAVSDGEGKEVAPKDDLGLYSGYQVGTRAESYAWIDLDKVKLTKMDANSEIEVIKEDKRLEINVKSGSLFFNITEPLADDESLNIRTSSMAVGIRGTCGWVTENTAALLEGAVEVTAGEQSVTVTAGEMAVLMDGTLEVKPFTAATIPQFVQKELEDDDTLAEKIKVDSGIDVLDIPKSSPELEKALRRLRDEFRMGDFFGEDDQYALVMMRPEDTLPTFLVREHSEIYSENSIGGVHENGDRWDVQVRRFDGEVWRREREFTVHMVTRPDNIGGSSIDYGVLGMSPDGNGLLIVWGIKSTYGEDHCSPLKKYFIDQYGEVGIESYWVNAWNGPLSELPAEYQLLPIDWYDNDNLSGVENWPASGNPNYSGPYLPFED